MKKAEICQFGKVVKTMYQKKGQPLREFEEDVRAEIDELTSEDCMMFDCNDMGYNYEIK